MKSLRSNARTVPGFTLVELLVTICIIGILAALIFPLYEKFVKSSTRAGDIQNLRSLSIASEQLSQDHKNLVIVGIDSTGAFGTDTTAPWFQLLRPMLGYDPAGQETVRAYISPGDTSKGGAVRLGPTRAFKFRSYGVNSRTQNSVNNKPLNKLSVNHPAKLMIIADYDIGTVGDSAGINSKSSASLAAIPKTWFGDGAANFLFLDGHVESIKVDDVMPGGSRFDLVDRDGVNP